MNATTELESILLRAGISLLVVWLLLALLLFLSRPRSETLVEVLRLLPDVLRLLRRLAKDPEVPRAARVRLWLLLAYLVLPFDLVPDFLPVIGQFDDVILVCVVLRSVVRRAGPGALERNWPGTEQGLALVWRAAGLPGRSDPPEARGPE